MGTQSSPDGDSRGEPHRTDGSAATRGRNPLWQELSQDATAFFLFPQVFYLVSVCLCVTVIVAFQLTAFTFRENLAATALLLALFGCVIRDSAAELRFVSWKRKSPQTACSLPLAL